MQLPDAEDAADMQWLRRMVFTSNRNLTQSEAYLIPATTANSAQVRLFQRHSLRDGSFFSLAYLT